MAGTKKAIAVAFIADCGGTSSMHDTALLNGKRFFDTYVASMRNATVIDIGAQDVHGSLRSACPANAKYIGVDFVEGNGVDVILNDPYKLPFETGSTDIVVSSSCFEHSEMFWVLFLEVLRVLKPTGLFYLNAPSNGAFHRYPVDCWRFYPDCGSALAKWSRVNGYNATVLEAYTSNQMRNGWNDYVCIFLKDANLVQKYPRRILHSFFDFTNGVIYPDLEIIINKAIKPEDQRLLGWLVRRKAQRLIEWVLWKK